MWSFLVTFVAILVCPYVVNGVTVSSWVSAFATAVVLSLLNMTLKPILVLLTLPISVLTLGLFLLVVNMLILKLTSAIVPGFTVSGWWVPFWGAAFISAIRLIFD